MNLNKTLTVLILIFCLWSPFARGHQNSPYPENVLHGRGCPQTFIPPEPQTELIFYGNESDYVLKPASAEDLAKKIDTGSSFEIVHVAPELSEREADDWIAELEKLKLKETSMIAAVRMDGTWVPGHIDAWLGPKNEHERAVFIGENPFSSRIAHRLEAGYQTILRVLPSGKPFYLGIVEVRFGHQYELGESLFHTDDVAFVLGDTVYGESTVGLNRLLGQAFQGPRGTGMFFAGDGAHPLEPFIHSVKNNPGKRIFFRYLILNDPPPDPLIWK